MNGLRVVGADPAHARAADLVKQALYILPLLHIAVAGGVLLLLLSDREIAASGDHHGGDASFDVVMLVHVLRKASGVGV